MLKFFIGSSKECLQYAEQVACWLEELGCYPIVWTDESVFPLGQYTFTSLMNISEFVDGAIFIFGADDKVWFRNESQMSVRDNVLLEYGIFCGRLSEDRVIFLCKGNPKIASDLTGITYADLGREYSAKKKFSNWVTNIKKEIEPNTYELNSAKHGDFLITSLFDALSIVRNNGIEFDTLRIFAISTFKSVQLLRLIPELKIKEARLLLRKYTVKDSYYDEKMQGYIQLAVKVWKVMEQQSNIEKLQLKYFDYHPDEGFYIFDNRYLIMGYLNFNIKTLSVEFGKEVMLIDNCTEAGRQWISAYTQRFEKIYENY